MTIHKDIRRRKYNNDSEFRAAEQERVRQYRMNNREQHLKSERSRTYWRYHNDPVYRAKVLAKTKVTNRKAAAKRRQTAQLIVGNGVIRCISCGYDANPLAVQIDHINNDGYLERATRQTFHIYRDIIANGTQGKYQLLCANCNEIKRIMNYA